MRDGEKQLWVCYLSRKSPFFDNNINNCFYSILFYHSYSIRITEIEDQNNIAVTWYYSNQRLLINRHAFLINLTRRTNTVGLDNNALQLLDRLQNKEKGEQVQQPKSEEEQEAEGERRTLSNSDSNQDLPAQQEQEHHQL